MVEREGAKEIVRHLLAGCDECAAVVRRTLKVSDEEVLAPPTSPTASSADSEHDYSGVFARVDRLVRHHQLRLADEEAAVPGLLKELEPHPWARREVLVSNSSRFHLWALVEALIQRARYLCQREPAESEGFAKLAIRIGGLLDPDHYGFERIQDLTARAWGELGSLLRIQERYRESETAFRKAQEVLRAGTGDPVEKANLFSLEASLLRDRRQFDRAAELLDRTIAISRKRGERGIHREALIRKAHCELDRERPEVALPLLLQAQGLMDPASDPRILYVVQHNILLALTKSGRFAEAAAGLEGTRALCEQLDYPLDSIRLEYLEGKILHGLGQLDKAEECFRTALQGMLDEGLHNDAALVGLDLAALLAQQNRHSEVRELAAAMLPVFTSHRIHREAIAALLVFQEAVKREKLSAQLVEELSTYLRNAASDPQLRFQPPAWLKSSKS